MLESCLALQVFAHSPDVWLEFAWTLSISWYSLLFSCCFKGESDVLYSTISELHWVVLGTR